MRLLLTRHHVLPGVYWHLPRGEKEIVRAILEMEMEAEERGRR